MTDFSVYELTELIDRLAKYTANYTRMLSDELRDEEEFAQIGEEIIALQDAIWQKLGFDERNPNA